jgi:hypothetical protein
MSDSAPITWFTENPTPILIMGGIAIVVLLVFFLRSGRAVLLMAMAGVALFMALTVLIDRLVVTDREQVANVIYQGAADAQRNDLNAIMAIISPSAAQVREEAQHWIGQAKLDDVSISAMDVELNRSANPLTATADFRVFAHGQILDRGTPYPVNYPVHLTVHLQREPAGWLVTSYERD